VNRLPHSCKSLHAVFVLLWALSPQLPAEPIVRRLEVATPRAFGYVIGDTLEHRVTLELARPYRLDEASLPAAGPLRAGLELRAPVVRVRQTRDTTRYEILLTYQVFQFAERLQTLAIPPVELRVDKGGPSLPVMVPEWRFSLAPLAPRRIEGSAALPELRPDRPPPTMPVRPHVYRLIALAAGLVTVLLYLAHAWWGLPLFARRKRPFARAFRDLRRLARKPFSETRYRDALRRLHRAFNQTAGRTLFADNLDLFFSHHPEFAGLRTPIEALFMQSRQAFYQPRQGLAADAGSLGELVQLCRRCRALERGSA
jgi:mxaA protein